MKKITQLLLLYILTSCPLQAQQIVLDELKAFPTADGFGENTTGGRGGRIVKVTNLNSNGPGSLDAALRETGPRIIVFTVGGTITHTGNDYLNIKEENGDVTVAGETAPGGGILIRGAELRISASNVIIRNIRFRQDSSTSTGSNLDALKIRGFNSTVHNVVIDHCSISWGLDENVSISNAENITFQRSIVSENIKSFLVQNSKNVSVLNTIHALTNERNIRANTVGHLDLTFEQINNLIYGVRFATQPSDGLKVSVENNIYEGSSQVTLGNVSAFNRAAPNPVNGETNTIENSYFFVQGNDIGPYTREIAPNIDSQYIKTEPLYRSSYVPKSINGLKANLLTYAGAFPRDGHDIRIIDHINAGTGEVTETGVFPIIPGGTAETDANNNGISDLFENEHSITGNGNNITSAWDFGTYQVINNAGYTDLEIYLAWLAGDFDILEKKDNSCSFGDYEVIVSGFEGSNVPCNLVDGNLTTRWGIRGNGQWAMVDLGSVQPVNQMQVAFYRGTSRTSDFYIEVSNDAVNWIDVYDGQLQHSSGTTTDLENFNFPLQHARYVRYLGDGNSENNWNSLLELRVNRVGVPVTGVSLNFETLDIEVGEIVDLDANLTPLDATDLGVVWSSADESIATVSQDGIVTAIAMGSTNIMVTTVDGSFTDTTFVTVTDNRCPFGDYEIIVSGFEGSNVPCNLVDGNTTTRWGIRGNGQWAMVDLGSVQPVNQMQVAFYRGTSRTSDFYIEVSNDAVNWIDVYNGQLQHSSGMSTDLEDFNFPLQHARYVRYLGDGNSENNWNSLLELRVNTFAECESVFIPDSKFEQVLIEIGADSDGVVNQSICRADAENVVDLDLDKYRSYEDPNADDDEPVDVTGLEAFVNLENLKCDSCLGISNLDLSSNVNLKNLRLVVTDISSLNLNGNVNIETLDIRNNILLNTLDLSNNPNLTLVGLFSNGLTSLNLKNGNNQAIALMDIQGNPSLDCVEVDNPTAAEGYSGWFKNSNVRYSTDCSLPLEQTVTLDPIQDAYLQGTTRFNTDVIRMESGNRIGYLMYDLSGVNGTVTSATLQFTIASDPGNGNINVSKGNGTAWTETNLSTSNRPISGTILGSINTSYAVGDIKTVDLTASEINGNLLSLTLAHTSGNDTDFASKEHANLAPARLMLTYTPGTNLQAKIEGEIPETTNMVVFPNPTTNTINISGMEGKKQILILDMTGRIVHEDTTSQPEPIMDMGIFPKGMYIVQIKGEHRTEVFRVVKQ